MLSTFDSYDEWRAFKEQESVFTKYWFIVIDMEIILFMFDIHSRIKFRHAHSMYRKNDAMDAFAIR